MKNTDHFILAVAEMRQAQKDYFRNRWPEDLRKSKELERKVDQMIEAHNESKHQTNLFDQ